MNDLKDEALTVAQCKRTLRIGGFEVSAEGKLGDWRAGWYLSADNQIKVALCYRGNVCPLSGVGYATCAHGYAEITEADGQEIQEFRDGSPDERANRTRRELKFRHDLILWRLDNAQEAVASAITNGDDVDLIQVARNAFCAD